MKDKKLKDLLHRVALNNNKPDYVVNTAYESVFKFIREEIQKGDPEDFDSFVTVRLKVLGTLYPSKGIYNTINKAKNGSKD